MLFSRTRELYKANLIELDGKFVVDVDIERIIISAIVGGVNFNARDDASHLDLIDSVRNSVPDQYCHAALRLYVELFGEPTRKTFGGMISQILWGPSLENPTVRRMRYTVDSDGFLYGARIVLPLGDAEHAVTFRIPGTHKLEPSSTTTLSGEFLSDVRRRFGCKSKVQKQVVIDANKAKALAADPRPIRMIAKENGFSWQAMKNGLMNGQSG